MNDATGARLIAEKGIWLSFQPFSDDGFLAPMPESSMARMRGNACQPVELRISVAGRIEKFTVKVTPRVGLRYDDGSLATSQQTAACCLWLLS
jgi:hypothetical protein